MRPVRLMAALALALAGTLLVVPAPAGATTCTLGPHAQCAGADLSGRNLDGMDLSGANLQGANLSRARLVGAKLVHANLTSANLSAAKLGSANFQGATMNQASLHWADATNADLSSVLLRHADLSGADLSGASLAGSQLDYANLTLANLTNVRAMGTNFALARLTDVQAGGGHFQGANLPGTHLHRADFGAAHLGGANFVGADFSNTKFLGAHITDTRVTPSNIGADPVARHYFFERVYTHVNAYGTSGSCSGSGSGDGSYWRCTGENDDDNATYRFADEVTFGWGSTTSGRRSFYVHGANIQLEGEADSGLASFHVAQVHGTLATEMWRTFDDAPRGQVGGPLAIHIGYHHEFLSGYHMTLSGWIQREFNAPTTSRR